VVEDIYKEHMIVASAWRLSDAAHWEPRVIVSWREGEQEKKAPLVFTKPCSTEREAELEGFQFAKKWIDEGKPELRVGPT
jgi:hypothetical protein